ncbi:hypothetical protein PR202_ga13653 [Eleusine coracana subsp. coracana]|uniref:Pentatricopeptide repeat-containing protein n=1 Tax=Eleusine coracana subsp. coracana TaxID=191504 RepID=A0AAV5CEK8_ELECO|nr:hypothetical protein PR202_ga13653 [Eleusine coracana subsp. coracana]
MPVRSVSSWNAMVSVYARQGRMDLAVSMFENMPERSIVSWNSIISGYNQNGLDDMALKFFSRMTDLNVISFTALLEGYVKIGDMKQAREIFDVMNNRDVVAWTATIVGYEQNGLNDKAMDLFRSMIKDGPEPNSYTLAAVLSVCASLAYLDYGKQIHCKAIRSLQEQSVSVSNAIISMYARSGSLPWARRVFDRISWRKETVTWTSMIMALAQHGLGEGAVGLFEEMLHFGVKPDRITYVGVFSACTHAGFVEQGKRYYEQMQKKHGVVPEMSHYACMVDLLARAGLLSEAQEFIQRMSSEPDAIVWGSLLSACRLHKKRRPSRTGSREAAVN